MNAATRGYFDDNGFLELETPFMGRYTPGGARNFLVPSRLNAGKFYALAESPQLYKQLFMVAGFDRYFQIVKCFRDEDLRLDRQPEFTQIDVEMSFVAQDDIFGIIEGLLKRLWKEVHGLDIPTPFPRLNFDESMEKYGNDKPDLRFGLAHVVLTDLVIEQFGAAASADGPRSPKGVRQGETADVLRHHIVKAMVMPAQYGQGLSRKDRQARGLREGHGRQGPRARQDRRERRLDAGAPVQDRHPRAQAGHHRGRRAPRPAT